MADGRRHEAAAVAADCAVRPGPGRPAAQAAAEPELGLVISMKKAPEGALINGAEPSLAAAAATAATAAATSRTGSIGASEPAVAAATAASAATIAAAVTAATAAAVAATSATTSTAAAAVTPATAITAGARRARFHGTGFIDHHAAAAQGLAVHARDGGLGFRIAAHFHKAEALGAAGVAFHHHLGARDVAELGERLFEIAIANGIRKIADVEFVAHRIGTPKKI